MYFTWKAKVVFSLGALFIFFVSGALWAQPVPPEPGKKITLSLHQVTCEDIFQQLSRKSGISFVYSTSVVDLKKPISISVYNQTLEEVLKEIARQMNLSFKPEGDHVVVKKSLESHSIKAKIQTKTVNDLLSPMQENNANTILASLSTQAFAAPFQRSVYDFTPGLLENDSLLSKKTAKLIAKIQHQLTLTNSDAKKNRISRTNWFVSAGAIFNDYALGGVEVQGGHRSLYAVVNASRLDNSHYRIGYGAGTSLPLSARWNLQLIYTAASITKEKDFVIFTDAIKLTSWHHQAKLSAQYSLSPKISIHGGLTFNLLNTRYKFLGISVPADIPFFLRSNGPGHREPHVSLSDVLRSSGTITTPYTLSNSYSDNNYLNTKTWIGFEVGASYRINFFTRR